MVTVFRKKWKIVSHLELFIYDFECVQSLNTVQLSLLLAHLTAWWLQCIYTFDAYLSFRSCSSSLQKSLDENEGFTLMELTEWRGGNMSGGQISSPDKVRVHRMGLSGGGHCPGLQAVLSCTHLTSRV